MITTFLITGATKGLGRAMALHLADLKYRVYVIGRTTELLDEIARKNPLIFPVQCDITKADDLEKIVSALVHEKDFSIIHNAAVVIPRLFANDNNNDFLIKQMETNFFAPLRLTQKLLPFLKSGQRVLHVSSQAASLALPGLMAYCISKSAFEQAARCLNAELAEKNIYFSILRPGMLDTPMQDQLRESSLTDLPGKDFYVQSLEENKLRDPDVVAKFVSHVMLETSDDEYVNKIWDINTR
jgi:NAD(P)-dependent dehydrogenase (short-subunit alcohol dehydrogenase family)